MFHNPVEQCLFKTDIVTRLFAFDPLVAQDLLSILQQSRKAIELMDADPYEITLDKDFILHIQKIKNNTN